jgi:hypothetical protein
MVIKNESDHRKEELKDVSDHLTRMEKLGEPFISDCPFIDIQSEF